MKKFIITAFASLLLVTFNVHASDSTANKNWQDIVRQAKQEGSLSFSVWYFQPQWREFVKNFEQEYGIKVRISEGTLDANLNKLLAETKRKKGKIDVITLSVNSLPIVQGAKAMEKIDWIPEYKNAWHKIQNVETQGYAVAFWGNQTGFAYDPQQMGNQPLPQTLDQLQQFIDEHPKKFGYNDPASGAAGGAFIERVITQKSSPFDIAATQVDPLVVKSWQAGWQWFEKNKANITFTSSGADSLTRLNDGELILTPAWEDHLASLQKSGAITSRLQFYIPKFGMPGGGNVIGIAANSPHSAAAAVFVNWIIQPTTQQQLRQKFGTRVLNKQLISEAEQPEDSVDFFGSVYATELKKQFISNVMMK